MQRNEIIKLLNEMKEEKQKLIDYLEANQADLTSEHVERMNDASERFNDLWERVNSPEDFRKEDTRMLIARMNNLLSVLRILRDLHSSESLKKDSQSLKIAKAKAKSFSYKWSRSEKSEIKKVLEILKKQKGIRVSAKYENDKLRMRNQQHFPDFFDRYANEREQEFKLTGKEKNPRLKVSLFGRKIGENLGIAATIKISAARKVRDYFKGKDVVFTADEVKALKNGDLNKILRAIFVNKHAYKVFINHLPLESNQLRPEKK